MESAKRKREFSHPRQIAMYLCRELTDYSLPKIGESFGGRDHTTIIHGCQKIENQLDKDEKLEKELIELEKRIKGI